MEEMDIAVLSSVMADNLSASELNALVLHTLFALIAATALAVSLPLTTGQVIFALVLAYNLAVGAGALVLGHRDWLRLWLFLVPLSALQIVPDAFLSSVLGVLVFPDVGFPRIGGVSAFMAGMWTIALFVVVFLGRSVEGRSSRRTALVWVSVASFVLFVGSEAVLWRVPVWYAQDVTMVGHVAVYVVVPEILLGLSTFLTYQALENRRVVYRLAGEVALMVLYLGALCCSYLVVEHVLAA